MNANDIKNKVENINNKLNKNSNVIKNDIENNVEKKVEVEVPTIVYKYVPVPIGDNLQEEVDGILQALPPDAAKELRSQLVEFTNTDLTEKEMPHAKAA